MVQNTLKTSQAERSYLRASIYAFPLIACASFLFLLWRAKFGYCFLDEPFIISQAQRLFQGNALIVDEWHVAQTSGSLVLPFYMLFHLFSDSNEGIMLCFRYVYCVLWWLSCLLIYKKLSVSEGKIASALVFLYLILFSPLDYMTLSYTSAGLAACLFLCCMMYRVSAETPSFSWGKACIFSLLWIVLTLSSPLMALFYILFFLFFLVGSLVEAKRTKYCYFRNVRKLCIASLPIIVVVCLLYLYVFIFSRVEFSKFLPSLGFVLNDPQHEKRNLIKAILSTPGYVIINAPLFTLACVVVFIVGTVKNCRKLRLPLFSVCALLYIAAQLSYTKSVLPGYEPDVPLLNQQMMYMAFLGLPAFALLEKRPYKQFLVFQGMGWFYTLMQNLSSNTRIMTIAMALTVAGVSGVLCCVRLFRELHEQYRGNKLPGRLAAIVICLVMTVQIGSQLCSRLYRTYYDASLSQLTEEIKYGSAKGLFTTKENAQLHNTLYENMDHLLSGIDTQGKKLLSLAEMPHIYLDAEMDFGTFSSWNCYLGKEIMTQRLEDYLSINPENTPDIVFAGSENDLLPFVENAYSCTEYRGSYLFVRTDD
ncbi:MAG: hypothetical protein IJ364_07500 [Oscillospiraceae bacterium]|nr:hypothetical protein [Oscillospiraceae bacterium]